MAGPWQRALDRARRRDDFLDLTDSRFHQNGLTPPREVFEAAFSRWLDTRAYDPDSRGAPRARQALAAFYGGQGWALDPSQFFLTAGTSEAYALAFSTLANAGDTVVLPRPGYPLFEHIAAHSRLKTSFYDQRWTKGWQLDPDSLESARGPQTKFVVVISPNNPTGQTATAEHLAAVTAFCLRHDVILVVDEVFDACWEGPGPLPRPGALFPDVKCITLNGISKRFGSPDLKLAWAVLSGPQAWVDEVGERLELANDTFLSANSYSQFLLPELFEGFGPWQREMRDLLAHNRRAVEAWMGTQRRVEGLVPRGGIHGLWRFELPVEWDDEGWSMRLLDEGLALHPGYFYDVQEPGVWLVYSLLKEPRAFAQGLERLDGVLRSVS